MMTANRPITSGSWYSLKISFVQDSAGISICSAKTSASVSSTSDLWSPAIEAPRKSERPGTAESVPHRCPSPGGLLVPSSKSEPQERDRQDEYEGGDGE